MLGKIPKTTKENPHAVWNAIADEEWSKWRLIMAENCGITFRDAFDRAMDDIDVAVANAALNKAMKQKKTANKGKGGK